MYTTQSIGNKKMELMESLKKEFIISLKRLNDSIKEIIESENYEYCKIAEIHKAYLEYCKSLKYIDGFAEMTVNSNIKLPKLLFKSNWAGNATLKEIILFGKHTKRNYNFESKVKEMFKDIMINLKLIHLCFENSNTNESYINELKTLIAEQLQKYRKNKRKEFIYNSCLAIIGILIIIILLFLTTKLY